MARQINAEDAKALLAELFLQAEEDFNNNTVPVVPRAIRDATERLFDSETQAYREALVGCAIARILDQKIDIRLPATENGADAFSGRSLADHVVTPFLRERRIPTSASPYLSALRGGARFVPGGEPRIQRDQEGFDTLVAIVDYLRGLTLDEARSYLRFLLGRFIQLRATVDIPLQRISKPNLEQLNALIRGLLTVKSGGRIPALLATAMFQTLSECNHLEWDVEYQGINVADKSSGAVGDITIRKGGAVVLGVEVTERIVEASRVASIFDQKISPSGISDYLIITTARLDAGALAAARSYTAVGHEMNLVSLAEWLFFNLATIGPACRAIFQSKVIDLLADQGADLKVAWNERMDIAIRVGPKPSEP